MADYFAVHQHLKDAPKSVRARLRTLDRSMVVLITAWWEAYCEQKVIEAASVLFAHTPSPADLPTDLQRSLALALRRDKNELSPWGLAGDAWRAAGINHAEALAAAFSTPNSTNASRLFRDALGLADVSSAWIRSSGVLTSRWSLDEWLDIRHRIAHTADFDLPLPKVRIKEYLGLVRALVRITEATVDEHVRMCTAGEGRG